MHPLSVLPQACPSTPKCPCCTDLKSTTHTGAHDGRHHRFVGVLHCCQGLVTIQWDLLHLVCCLTRLEHADRKWHTIKDLPKYKDASCWDIFYFYLKFSGKLPPTNGPETTMLRSFYYLFFMKVKSPVITVAGNKMHHKFILLSLISYSTFSSSVFWPFPNASFEDKTALWHANVFRLP